VRWGFDKRRYYANLDFFAGHQSDRLGATPASDFIGGGDGTFGVRFSKHTSVELYAEGGNFALGSTGGWSYFTTSVQLNYAF
jgi:hypothetical protein